MNIDRIIKSKVIEFSNSFRAIAIMGPRQCGKTTLVKQIFPSKPYLNFENIDVQLLANDDPRGFLSNYSEHGAVFDEIHRAPIIFNYLQEILDNESEKGKYILTGSSNFLLNDKISQSLAGRVGFIEMNTLSMSETSFYKKDIWSRLLKGGYPEVWSRKVSPQLYYPSYIQSFLERDIRQLIQLSNLRNFQLFLRLAATRIGQEWAHSKVAHELGVDSKTIAKWVSLLVSSGIIYFLPPYYRNLGKRITKKPKLYFYDTGIVCNLLSIQNLEHIHHHPMKGNLYENQILMELVKLNQARIIPKNFYFWRTVEGHEIDLVIEESTSLTLIEIKSGLTFHKSWWKNIEQFPELKNYTLKKTIIYPGEENWTLSHDKSIIHHESSYKILENY